MISKTLRPVAPALASVLALVLATGAVSAQDAGAAPAKRPAPLMQLDTDGDGRITRAEYDAPRLERLKAMDPDQDGFVTLEEMKADAVARATKRAEAMAERRFQRLDADGDGKISAAEAMMAGPEGRPGPKGGKGHGPQGKRMGPMGGDFHASLFDRLDTDKDGVLSAEELEAAKRMMERGPRHGAKTHHGHHGPDGDRGPRGPRPGAAPEAGADKPAAN
ncbi:EF-hand domain-containing protein [Falsigemmobacter faecalis]|uniref:EF-hand domain-containing protein n=1 Tax=Falsigemmobacter faecalis TaxID=2488730 RepID=A0A3P3DRX3_9RHOB|nr:EF-hand domain-containing protein [Falsigemmobacter faecalis]RRH76945.1 hypothetical protein EG244_04895 [Falsigemmobacter faecalis]